MCNLYLIHTSWIFQLHQSAHSLRVWQSPLIPSFSWAMNCINIWEELHLVCSLLHNRYQVLRERRASLFSLKFVSTNDNNLNLASFLKILTKPSRTISFKTMSSLINYKSLMKGMWLYSPHLFHNKSLDEKGSDWAHALPSPSIWILL